MVCQRQSPRVAFASVLPLKRGLNVQPLSLPAGFRHQRWTSLHFAHPQASWVTFGHNLCACLGWLVSLKTRVLKGSDISVVLPVENKFCQVCALAGVLGPAGGKQRLCTTSPPRAPPQSPPCASYWPETGRGRKGPINFSLIQLDPETKMDPESKHNRETLLR